MPNLESRLEVFVPCRVISFFFFFFSIKISIYARVPNIDVLVPRPTYFCVGYQYLFLFAFAKVVF